MAAVLGAAALLLPSSSLRLSSIESPKSLVCFSYKQRLARPLQLTLSRLHSSKPHKISNFVPFASSGETAGTEEVENATIEEADEIGVNGGDIADMGGHTASVVQELLQSYKEALANYDLSGIVEMEAFFQTLEDEKNSLATKVTLLAAELSAERDRVLRISADFDNFRKRTERERLSLMTNVQGEVVESLLPVLDNFARAKDQIKVETEGEEKINSSYQSIYKQFQEVLISLGVEAVETVGTAFDPLLHEAIMREDSTEYKEGIVLQEFRKGFKLGERLLRPSMVKVSAGPGPAKLEDDDTPADGDNGADHA